MPNTRGIQSPRDWIEIIVVSKISSHVIQKRRQAVLLSKQALAARLESGSLSLNIDEGSREGRQALKVSVRIVEQAVQVSSRDLQLILIESIGGKVSVQQAVQEE